MCRIVPQPAQPHAAAAHCDGERDRRPLIGRCRIARTGDWRASGVGEPTERAVAQCDHRRGRDEHAEGHRRRQVAEARAHERIAHACRDAALQPHLAAVEGQRAGCAARSATRHVGPVVAAVMHERRVRRLDDDQRMA